MPGPCIQQNALLLPHDPIFWARSKLPTRNLDIFYSLLARTAEKREANVEFQAVWAHVSNQEHQVSPRGASDWWRESVRKSVSVHQDKIRGSAILAWSSKSASTGLYRHPPKNPALQMLQRNPKSAFTSSQRPIWNRFGIVVQHIFPGNWQIASGSPLDWRKPTFCANWPVACHLGGHFRIVHFLFFVCLPVLPVCRHALRSLVIGRSIDECTHLY